MFTVKFDLRRTKVERGRGEGKENCPRSALCCVSTSRYNLFFVNENKSVPLTFSRHSWPMAFGSTCTSRMTELAWLTRHHIFAIAPPSTTFGSDRRTNSSPLPGETLLFTNNQCTLLSRRVPDVYENNKGEGDDNDINDNDHDDGDNNSLSFSGYAAGRRPVVPGDTFFVITKLQKLRTCTAVTATGATTTWDVGNVLALVPETERAS